MEPETRPALPGRTTNERVDGAAGAALCRQHAAACLAWEAAQGRDDLDELDLATAAISLDGAEW